MRISQAYRHYRFWLRDALRGAPLYAQYADVRFIARNDNAAGEARRRVLLHHFLHFATSHSPYYKEFKGASLHDFPLLSKADLIEQSGNLLVDPGLITGHKGSYYVSRTSGSTGTPLSVQQDYRCRLRHIATIKHENDCVGLSTGIPSINLRSVQQGGVQHGLDSLNNIWNIDNSRLNEQQLAYIISLMQERRIGHLRAYASSLDILVSYIVNRGINLPFKTHFISLGERLHPATEKLIRNTLGCKVTALYSCMEHGLLGHSLHDGSLTDIILNRANTFLEILHPDRDEPVADGKLGRIVITNFSNYAMPLIRYDIGDMAAVAARNEAGGISRLKNLIGRKTDMVCNCRGEWINFYSAIPVYIFDNEDIRRFQVAQTAPGLYELRVALRPGAEPLPQERVHRDFRDILGAEARVRVVYVDEIPLLASGKSRVVINEMRNE